MCLCFLPALNPAGAAGLHGDGAARGDDAAARAQHRHLRPAQLARPAAGAEPGASGRPGPTGKELERYESISKDRVQSLTNLLFPDL